MTRQQVVDGIVRLTKRYIAEHGAANTFFPSEYARDLGTTPLQVGAALADMEPFPGLLPFDATVTRPNGRGLAVVVSAPRD